MTRDAYSGSSSPPVSGTDFLDQYSSHVGRLWDASALPLTSVAGTGDAVTATLSPALTAGLVNGMKFTITWGAANTGAVTLSINGGSPVPVVDKQGNALIAGALASGLRSLLEYVGTTLRVLTEVRAGASSTTRYWSFTASGTWTKPSGLDPDALVGVQLWAGGGSGRRSNSSDAGGGQGGSYVCAFYRAGDLPSSVAVTVGAGGAAQSAAANGNAGGTSSFGSILAVTGGQGGVNGIADAGGIVSAGSIRAHAMTSGIGGFGQAFGTNGNGSTYGGGGGGGASNAGTAGGASVFGGAGGGGGDGTPPAAAGIVPGGGGGGLNAGSGSSGAGARGEVNVWIV